jgi:hypothetical protein
MFGPASKVQCSQRARPFASKQPAGMSGTHQTPRRRIIIIQYERICPYKYATSPPNAADECVSDIYRCRSPRLNPPRPDTSTVRSMLTMAAAASPMYPGDHVVRGPPIRLPNQKRKINPPQPVLGCQGGTPRAHRIRSRRRKWPGACIVVYDGIFSFPSPFVATPHAHQVVRIGLPARFVGRKREGSLC